MSAIKAELSRIQELADLHPGYSQATDSERFWYRSAVLDCVQIIMNELAGCEDLDQGTLHAVIESHHELWQDLFDVSKVARELL